MTAIERIQTSLHTLGLKAVEPRLEGLFEQAFREEADHGKSGFPVS